MTTQEFKDFCKNEFRKRGFKKVKNMYYLDGESDVLCGIWLQRSDFGNCYYINVFYSIKGFNENFPYPKYCDSDIDRRMEVMSKTETYQGEHYMTAMFEYERYEPEELEKCFEREFEEWILPAVYEGTSFIVPRMHFDGLRPDPMREEEIFKYLNLSSEDIRRYRADL